ncbi:MAG: Phospholipase D/competence protein ComEA helix-hairpin-helix domain protein [Candidatus Adlerbacteria bacterium GW2011_GWC1_50_9]|uniref:Phospholipase D/competence protein ComEA helix-hairpin-helix domain protein n=1 Tax=Candidatus Adlerbacteria bacterium GW2011_GWC1_50_9 TaxID=1618608 RepID=A0A0G1WQ57_9BACT|nr:MAG: Phospholipase D/competence protein ComEA helix-hairpin-helix domain protein [Candidatus Adlerbacteria bacterium GW2011_GWC1_50_9]
MENHRFVKYFTILLGGMLFFSIPLFLLAYSDETTHPALTDEIVDHFNRFYPERALSASQKELMKLGSREEDEETRWLQHFYDPIYNRGLMTLGKEWENAKSWSQNTLAQASEDGIWKDSTYGSIFSLFSSDSDFSWERAIYEYAWGDKNRAILALGHVLHLLEDASVPDHTRNDPHPHITELFSISNASPYEVWTKKFTPDNLALRINESPITLGSLNGYFDSMAGYSNRNFFSKDTVLANDYALPQIEGIIYENSQFFAYTFDEKSQKYKLVKMVVDFSDSTKLIPFFDNNDSVLTDYWSRLSKQAVLHGAGAVKLFFDEVEKERATKTLYNKNRSWLTKTTEKVVDGVKSVFGSVSSGVIGAYGGLAGIFFGGEDSAMPQEPDTRNTEPQESTITPPPPAQTSAPSPSARIDTGTTSSNNKPRASVIPIASPPPSQTTSPFLPIAGVGGAPPKEKSPSGETAIALAPQIVEAGTTTASTTATTTVPSVEPPTILEPGAGTSTFATTTLIFLGAAEPNRIIREIITNASTTSDTDGAWMLALFSLPEGTTTLTFFAEDFAGNISSGTPRIIFIYLPEATSSPPDDTPPPALVGPIPGPLVGDIAEIPMLYSPKSLVITNDGAKALIADGNRISELELASGRVRIVARGLENPTRMAIEASGETALLLEAGKPEFPGDPIGRILRVNILTGEKTILATGFINPRGIAIEREGETALVRTDSGIYRLDLLTGSTTLFAYTNINGDIAVGPGATQAFFLTEEIFQGLGVIKKIDLATDEVTTIAGPLEGSIRGDAIELSPDGTFALVIVSAGDSGIKKIDLATGEESYLFSTGPAPFGSYSITDIALSPDASEVFFWWTSPNEGLMLSSINLTNREFKTIARARAPRAIAITQNGSSIITASPTYFGWYFDEVELENGIGTRLAGFAENAISFALFPSDTEIVTTNVSYDFISSIKRINLTTGLISTIATNLPSQAIYIAIEPNGETALVSTIGMLLRVNLTTGETTVIADQIDGAGPIAIDSTGANAFLASSNGITTSLLRVDLASGTTTRIADMDAVGVLAGIGLDPDGENAVVGSAGALVRVNLLTGETTPILSMLCEEASIRNMALESTGAPAAASLRVE